jgi:hypothetical protein
MSTSDSTAMSPAESAYVAEAVERLRQLRRRRGVPNGVSLEEAVTLHMLTADEIEHARWGQPSSPVLEEATT